MEQTYRNCVSPSHYAFSFHSPKRHPHALSPPLSPLSGVVSSIGRSAKTTGEAHEGSSRSIGLSFSKHNHSKRSLRLRESKENRESSNQIESDSRVTFKDRPPRQRKNPSKSIEEDYIYSFNHFSSTLSSTAPLNGYLKTSSNLSMENFCVLRKLGEGSFSQVFQVLERDSGAVFALKVMEKEGLREMQVVDRLASELKIQLFCNHVNIAKLYGVFHDENRVYLIQEFAGTRTLFSLMEERRQSGFSLREVQAIIVQLCNAVRYLHDHSIIHRDIKPENILLGAGGVTKLADFGWSIYNPTNTLRETLCGTPLYLSPELLSKGKYDCSVDLWAIGVLTFELITGKMPFGILSFKDLGNIVTQEVDLSGVSDPFARSFITDLLTKEIFLRKDIRQICEHEFLRLPQQMNN